MRISDTHNDFLTKLNDTEYFTYLNECEKQGVENLLCSIFTSELKKDSIIQKIENDSCLILAYGKSGYKIHIEDLGFLNSSKEIEKLLSIAPFSCSLTWNNDNQFAGGNFGFKTISKNGKKLISLLEESKVIIDVAHLNRKSFGKFISINNKPIFCSHTGLCMSKKSPRNLTDSQIKEIISTGGYYGLFLSSTYMTNKGRLSSKSFANIIYKTFCKFGDNNVGLGSDFYGISPNPTDISNYTGFKKVVNELERLGVQKVSIDKFFYKNFADFKSAQKIPPLS